MQWILNSIKSRKVVDASEGEMLVFVQHEKNIVNLLEQYENIHSVRSHGGQTESTLTPRPT